MPQRKHDQRADPSTRTVSGVIKDLRPVRGLDQGVLVIDDGECLRSVRCSWRQTVEALVAMFPDLQDDEGIETDAIIGQGVEMALGVDGGLVSIGPVA